MKQIGHYFPFFVLTILLYGWFFYYHNQSTMLTPLPLHSGEQAVQLQLLEMEEITEERAEESELQNKEFVAEEKSEPEVKAESELTTKQTDNSETIPTVENKEVITAPANLLVEDIDSQNLSEIKIANQALQETIQKTAASSDAMLKAELFEADFHLDLPAPPAAQRTAQNKQAETPAVNSKKVKTMLSSAPSSESEILQAPQKPKHIFKKQPAVSPSSESDQGVLQEAIVVSGNKPVYPKRAILRNQQGRVIVKLTVTTRGKSKDPEIITSSGHTVLDDAVLDFIKGELFMPAHQGEEKITTQQIFSFRFELK
ncbi:MAG: protein TonB [Psychromonas sp.]|jgi:protein TonB|uniref:energy transducer TonB n=1 Tax=Psychromonas sp. TaxID=1884585 RepID=UPI0039E653F3